MNGYEVIFTCGDWTLHHRCEPRHMRYMLIGDGEGSLIQDDDEYSETYHTDYPVLHDNGTIAYDRPEAVPSLVRALVQAAMVETEAAEQAEGER